MMNSSIGTLASAVGVGIWVTHARVGVMLAPLGAADGYYDATVTCYGNLMVVRSVVPVIFQIACDCLFPAVLCFCKAAWFDSIKIQRWLNPHGLLMPDPESRKNSWDHVACVCFCETFAKAATVHAARFNLRARFGGAFTLADPLRGSAS